MTKLRVEPLTVVVIMVIVLLFTSGCSWISLKVPTTQALTKTAAFLAGYEIGKSRPELAEEFIHYTQVDREDVVVLYDSWKRYLAYRLGADPVHRKLIENMLDLVEIDLELKVDAEKEKIIRELFTEFIEGLQVGIDAGSV